MAPKFSSLWAAHPAIKGTSTQPCQQPDGTPNFDNQCAICLGLALRNGGIDMSGYPKSKCCWFAGHVGHTLRAEELANWMKARPATFGTVVKTKHTNAANYLGRKGIVLCRNFWGPGLQGDHIDLWDGTQLAHGSDDYFERSQEVWFWAWV